MKVSSIRLLAAGLVLALAVSLAACSGGQPPQSTADRASQPEATEEVPATQGAGEPAEGTPAAEPPATADTFPKGTKSTTKLIVKDVKVGTGPEASPGKTVSVQYTGWLVDGKKFDSSRDSGQPIQFQLGSGRVIPGWEQGIAGMKVGGKRILVIPPDLGYGAQGYPPVIPGNATLVFAVELVGVSG